MSAAANLSPSSMSDDASLRGSDEAELEKIKAIFSGDPDGLGETLVQFDEEDLNLLDLDNL